MTEESTTVRILKPAAGALAAVAPGLAARALERLFLTPARWAVPRREIRWMAGAQRATVRFDEARELPVLSFGNGPTVLLVHGWSGRGSQMGAFVEPLVRRGLRVVTFDAPSHGEADGRLSGLPEFATAIELLASRFGPFRAIVAHSLGAAATTVALSRGLPVERVVYVAPPSSPGEYLGRAARLLGFGDGVAKLARERIERRFDFPFDEASGTSLARDLRVPLLVIHDLDDREVFHEEGKRLAEAWPGASLLTTRGLGHRRILRDAEVVDAVLRFVAAGVETSSLEGRPPSAGRASEPWRYGSSYEESLELADGRVVTLRLLQPTDKEKLRDGLARMSPESRYYRFMGVRNDLDESALRYLCELDGVDHFAIGAVAADGSDEGVAVARFVRLKDEGTVAEPAITVVDGYQGQGLGRLLLERLASAARERGVDTFRCELLSSNLKARRLLTSFDPKAVVRQAGPATTMELDLGGQRRDASPPRASAAREPGVRFGGRA